MGLFARLPGWNPCGLPRSRPRQRRKTRRGPPDPPQRSPEPPLRKSSQGTKAPALQIPWFLCRPCRDKGTTTWHDEPDLDPVVPLWRSARQGNHDPRISPRSPSRGSFVAPEATKEPRPAKPPTLLIPWFLSSAQRDKGTTTWGARGAFVLFGESSLAHGAGGDLEPGRRLVGRGGVSLFTFCAAGAERISERPAAIQPVRRVKRDTPPLHANPVPDYAPSPPASRLDA